MPARVAVEDKHHYVIYPEEGEFLAHATGKLLYQTEHPSGLPKVGDWVAVQLIPNEHKALIHHVLPRRTKLSRKVPGKEVEEQVLATNIDIVFTVESLDERFNPRLLERYLVMVHESGAKGVVVLNKTDLCDSLKPKLAEAQSAAGSETDVVAVSAKTGRSLRDLKKFIAEGVTIVFIGPSGVGKSTLINRFLGEEVQATIEVRETDSKGRHTTTRRELFVLPEGGLLIDTPGMREFQLWGADERMQSTFTDIDALALQCHFTNCTHTTEKKCAVLAGLADGTIHQERYQSYVKLQRELAAFEEAQTERGYVERRRRSRVAQRAMNRYNRG